MNPTAVLDDLIARYPQLAPCHDSIAAAEDALARCVAADGLILVAGNGGSAADAEHIVGELMKGFLLPRTLDDAQRARIADAAPEGSDALASGLQRGIRAIALTSAGPLASAIANDTNPDFVFAQQAFVLGRPTDVLIAISTSGNSRNLLHAAGAARAQGVRVVGLTGRGGGRLADVADLTIRVPADRVHEIQELHLPVYHALCAMLEARFFGAETAAPDLGPALGRVEVVVLDFDGVLTDNTVVSDENGLESVRCHRGDSLGLAMLAEAGVECMILTKETNAAVRARGGKLKIPVVDCCDDKATFLKGLLAERKLNPRRVAYVGNDLNDLGAMAVVGLSAAPRDSHPDVLKIADVRLRNDGGRGAIREFCEMLLNSRR